MVDSATLIEIATLVQTAVISITLIVFVLQFRSQGKAVKEASYQGLIGRYNELISTLVDKPEVALSLFMSSGLAPEAAKDATQEDIAVYSHLLLAFGIIEEAYTLHERRWINDDEWQQWAAFPGNLSRHPMFPLIARMTSGTFDKGFEEYVASKLRSS